MWEQLTKKGYEITNKRVLGNPAYTSEQTKNKDLVQELALVQYWLFDNFEYNITIHSGNYVWAIWYFNIDKKNSHSLAYCGAANKDFYNTPEYTKIAAIEYTINNLI